jgi:hypothetical protein
VPFGRKLFREGTYPVYPGLGGLSFAYFSFTTTGIKAGKEK